MCYLLLSLTCCCVSGVIECLGMGVVPYVVLLVVPVLGQMSDQCEDVRLMATYCFATLIRLMPLEVSPWLLFCRALCLKVHLTTEGFSITFFINCCVTKWHMADSPSLLCVTALIVAQLYMYMYSYC